MWKVSAYFFPTTHLDCKLAIFGLPRDVCNTSLVLPLFVSTRVNLIVNYFFCNGGKVHVWLSLCSALTLVAPGILVLVSLACLSGVSVFAYYYKIGCDPIKAGIINDWNQVGFIQVFRNIFSSPVWQCNKVVHVFQLIYQWTLHNYRLMKSDMRKFMNIIWLVQI